MATVGGVAGLVVLIMQWFGDDAPLKIGQTGVTGPYAVSLRRIDCGKARADLPKEIKREVRGSRRPFPIKGQLCFARFVVRNRSDASRLLIPVASILYVRENEFSIVASVPIDPPQVFPDEQIGVLFVFDLPKRVQPTAVDFAGFNDRGDEPEDPVTWSVSG